MTERTKKEFGVRRWDYDLIETDRSSIFDVTFPQSFGLGRNRFTIYVTSDKLLKGSDVYIDILDVNQNPIYFEISNLANTDNTRNVVVYVYDTTPIGNCTVYIAGTRKVGRVQTLSSADYLFKTTLPVDSGTITDTPLVFKYSPTVTFTEKLQPVLMPSDQNRFVQHRNLSGSISTATAIAPPRNLSTSPLNIERPINQSEMVAFRSTGSANVIEQSQVPIPTYSEYSNIVSRNFEFSSSMVGGMIEVGGMSVERPRNVREDYTSSFSNIRFSASIMEVVNTGSIKIYPPFQEVINYVTVDGASQTYLAGKFNGHLNFTCSYYDYPVLSLAATTQSFVTMDISGIEPEFGHLKTIGISYKPVSSFGDYRPIGTFNNVKTNIFTDPDTVMFDNVLGLVEKPLGNFSKSLTNDDFDDFERYWDVFGGGGIPDKGKLQDSMFVSGGENYYIKPKSQYFASVQKDTEYVLEFESVNQNKGNLNVFISGTSEIQPIGIIGKTGRISDTHDGLGTFIGSISSNEPKKGSSIFTFKALSSGTAFPVYGFDTGSWNISSVSVSPTNEPGFSGNHARLQIPIVDVESRTELMLRVQYSDGAGKYSERESLLSGVVFEGNRPEIIYPSSSKAKKDETYTSEYQVFREATFNNSGTDVLGLTIPIFQTAQRRPYSGSTHNVGMGFTIETVVFGRTGSAQQPLNVYCWASTLQGRATVSRLDNFGQPMLYYTVAHSGSTVNQIGTFGRGPVLKPNLDSWFGLYSVATNTNGELEVQYRLTSTSSFYWEALASSHTRAVYYEHTV